VLLSRDFEGSGTVMLKCCKIFLLIFSESVKLLRRCFMMWLHRKYIATKQLIFSKVLLFYSWSRSLHFAYSRFLVSLRCSVLFG